MWGFIKSTIGLFVYGMTAAILITAAGLWWASMEIKKPGPLTERKFFIVEKGDGVRKIGEGLKANNIIENDLLFLAAVRIRDVQGDLKAGEYQFDPGITVSEVIHKIATGAVVPRAVTIPEGLTSFQIIQRLKAAPEVQVDTDMVPEEGILLPETYTYSRDEKISDILKQMNAAMVQTITELWPGRAADLPFSTTKQAMTLASIIEKETGVPSERRRIAGVFVNRLKQNMPLQTDPTVIYALTKGQPREGGLGPLGRRLVLKDLEYDSPYNTYMYVGLPPGPIANPGRASIEAALNPERHDYLYFVADGRGGHVFAKTLAEHNANVVKWRQIRKESGN